MRRLGRRHRSTLSLRFTSRAGKRMRRFGGRHRGALGLRFASSGGGQGVGHGLGQRGRAPCGGGHGGRHLPGGDARGVCAAGGGLPAALREDGAPPGLRGHGDAAGAGFPARLRRRDASVERGASPGCCCRPPSARRGRCCAGGCWPTKKKQVRGKMLAEQK